jgi:hypothetical protein
VHDRSHHMRVMAGHSRPKDGVAFARLCPAIHVLLSGVTIKAWMPGTSPGMTKQPNKKAPAKPGPSISP